MKIIQIDVFAAELPYSGGVSTTPRWMPHGSRRRSPTDDRGSSSSSTRTVR
jgi:hypothetical protein